MGAGAGGTGTYWQAKFIYHIDSWAQVHCGYLRRKAEAEPDAGLPARGRRRTHQMATDRWQTKSRQTGDGGRRPADLQTQWRRISLAQFTPDCSPPSLSIARLSAYRRHAHIRPSTASYSGGCFNCTNSHICYFKCQNWRKTTPPATPVASTRHHSHLATNNQ